MKRDVPPRGAAFDGRPLPPAATVLTFSLAGQETPAGDLIVDLIRGDAAWHPRR